MANSSRYRSGSARQRASIPFSTGLRGISSPLPPNRHGVIYSRLSHKVATAAAASETKSDDLAEKNLGTGLGGKLVAEKKLVGPLPQQKLKKAYAAAETQTDEELVDEGGKREVSRSERDGRKINANWDWPKY